MMDLGKLIKEFIMNDNIFTISVASVVISFIGALLYYNVAQLNAIEKNVETAIAKGIDPIAVRCAYANERDVVCVAYAAAHPVTPTPVKSGK
jgi:hypothetical protein